jgi:hypothetical protein
VRPLSIEPDRGQEWRVGDLDICVGLADSIACGGEIEVVLLSL